MKIVKNCNKDNDLFWDAIQNYHTDVDTKDLLFLKEFILWSLVELKQLSLKKSVSGVIFNDVYDSYIKGL